MAFEILLEILVAHLMGEIIQLLTSTVLSVSNFGKNVEVFEFLTKLKQAV